MKPIFVVALGREELGIGHNHNGFRVWLVVENHLLRVNLHIPFVFTLHTRNGFYCLLSCLGLDFLSGTLAIAGHGGERLVASLGDEAAVAVLVSTSNGNLTILIL